jgi:hypothetical protein
MILLECAMGGEAAQTAPKIDKLGDEAKTMGNKAEDAGEKGGTGLGKIGIAAGVAGAAFAAGMKVLELAADAARAVVDKFGEALDLGGEGGAGGEGGGVPVAVD